MQSAAKNCQELSIDSMRSEDFKTIKLNKYIKTKSVNCKILFPSIFIRNYN